MNYSARVKDAFALMYDLHGKQVRKGSEIAYITHPMMVAALVGQYEGTEDQFIAALLHDAVEDQGGRPTLERIRALFGDQVADFVLGCSDSEEEPKPPWRERKERYIANARGASPAQKLIIACDKLHNAQCIIADLRSAGPALWGRFTAGRDGSLWYYDQMYLALAHGWNHPLLAELAAAVARIHELDEA